MLPSMQGLTCGLHCEQLLFLLLKVFQAATAGVVKIHTTPLVVNLHTTHQVDPMSVLHLPVSLLLPECPWQWLRLRLEPSSTEVAACLSSLAEAEFSAL